MQQPVYLLSKIVARLRGPIWLLQADEARALSESLVAVIGFIPLPERETALGLAIGNLTAVLGAIVLDRIITEQLMAATGAPVPPPAAVFPSAAAATSSSQPPTTAAAEPNGHGSAADLLANLINQP